MIAQSFVAGALVACCLGLPASAQGPQPVPGASVPGRAEAVAPVSPSPQKAGQVPYPVLKQGPPTAGGGTCKALVAAKNLTGKERTNYLEGCKRLMIKQCGQVADDQGLKGDAKRAFNVRCVRDGIGQ